MLSTPPAFVLSQDQTLMFNPFLASRFLSSCSPKHSPFPRKPSVYSLRNLTVYYLDLLHCIVFKDRFAFVLSLNAGFIIAKHPLIVKPFFQISDIFFQPHHIVEKTDHGPRDVVSEPVISNRSGSAIFVKKQIFREENEARYCKNTCNCQRKSVD